MKKNILTVALLIISIKSFSQTLTIGPKAGVNINTLTNLEDTKARAGLTAGGFLVWSFIENFGVGVDALYSREGAKYAFQVDNGEHIVRYESRTDLNYLRFNVPFTYFFRQEDDVLRPKIYAGPSFAFLLSAKEKSEVISANDNTITSSGEKTTVTDSYKTGDFGALVGAGLNYKICDATWLNFDAAYHIGGTDIPKLNIANGDAVHNSGFAFTVGVGFGF